MKNKNGFTLIELLAVIAILAIILAIAVPKMINVLDENKEKVFLSSLKSILREAEYMNLESKITRASLSELNIDELSNKEYDLNASYIYSLNNQLYIYAEGMGEFDGLKCRGNSITLTCDINSLTDKACFTFNSETGEITDYDDNCEKDVKIPETIDGVAVTSIGSSAFKNNSLTSVTIPDSVAYIGTYAFESNNLTSVTIPNSVASIADYAFYNNSLTSVTIPDSVTIIRTSAFANNSLTSVTIPNSVTSIGKYAFNNNQLPDSEAFIYARNSDGSEDITTIVSYGGAKRDNVVIPNSVTNIGRAAFRSNSLTSVTIPDSVTSIGKYAFEYNNLTSVTIPNSVTSIGNYAFYKTSYSNSSLTSIVNKTSNSFDWGNIINGSSGYNFVTGTVENGRGNVEITSE